MLKVKKVAELECPMCGYMADEEAQYCPECGELLKKEETIESA